MRAPQTTSTSSLPSMLSLAPLRTPTPSSLLAALPRRTRLNLARGYASAVGVGARPKSRKVYDSADEAVRDVKSGDILLSGGFGLCGTPDTLIQALAKRSDVTGLTGVSNNAGVGKKGLGG